MPYRAVKDLDLFEVSILDRTKSPAYDGTLITARAEGEELHYRGEDFIDDVEIDEEETPQDEGEGTKEPTEKLEETRDDTQPEQQEIADNNIDYSKYEQLIKEMKEEN